MKKLTLLLVGLTLSMGTMSAAWADEDAKIQATLGRLATACKNKVAMKYKVSQAEANVQVAATLQESLDSGAMGLKDLREYGASYNWSVASKKASGSCDVDAKGKITQFTAK